MLGGPAAARVPLAESDPLPPEDHVVAPRDTAPLESLYRKHASRLARYFRRRGGCGADASDLLHDTFLRVVRTEPDHVRELERPEAYLSTIAANLLHDRARADARRETGLGLYAQEVELVATDELRRLEARDMLNRLESAMQRLRPRTREIFMAHRLDGLTYGEIAERTGLSVKAVEKHMSRAIAHLDRTFDRLR